MIFLSATPNRWGPSFVILEAVFVERIFPHIGPNDKFGCHFVSKGSITQTCQNVKFKKATTVGISLASDV